MAFPVHLDGNLDGKNDEEENCRNDVNETCQTGTGKYLPNFAAIQKRKRFPTDPVISAPRSQSVSYFEQYLLSPV